MGERAGVAVMRPRLCWLGGPRTLTGDRGPLGREGGGGRGSDWLGAWQRACDSVGWTRGRRGRSVALKAPTSRPEPSGRPEPRIDLQLDNSDRGGHD